MPRSDGRRTRLKVCCIASVAEAALALEAGADAVGLVGPMPSGPGTIDAASARAVAQWAPPPLAAWLLSSETDATAIFAHARLCAVTTVQIVNHVDEAVHRALAHAAPDVKRVQVVHVEDEEAVALARAYAPLAHALLLDSGRPSAFELGGTGRRHDWSVAARCVAAVECPVFLAGGLDPSNVAEAVATVRPFGLDVCSGLRTGGRLDADKLTAFASAIPHADAARSTAPAALG